MGLLSIVSNIENAFKKAGKIERALAKLQQELNDVENVVTDVGDGELSKAFTDVQQLVNDTKALFEKSPVTPSKPQSTK